jgi:hypothetical protein|tara:strand:+ start:99 stop:1733 length:1635 start_codon:yes stop_codon:yes gene_type:complete
MNDEDNVTGGDLAKSITFEIAANTLLDKYTAGLLVAPDPSLISKGIYALTNVGGSALINYFAQRIRGGDFNLGELLTAGGLSLVPGGVQAKSLSGRVVRGTTKGAGLGALQVTGESLINEGKPPELQDLALGATFGGGLGGALSGVSGPEAAAFIKGLKKRIGQSNRDRVRRQIFEGARRKAPLELIMQEQEGVEDLSKYGFGPEGPAGGATDDQIMQAYRERTGELDLDPFRGKTPEEATRDEVAAIVNPESDLNLFKNTGKANIRRIKANFTEQELRLLKRFENHHNVPLKQSGWLVYGLPSDELAKTQFYLAQRGVKGGNVLEQIRIYPEGIHDQAHELGERIIGQMRKRQGRSIERILGDLDPADYARIQTFEGRKQYIDKFIDGITEIETKINKILDALYANRLNDDTALEALIDINENVDDPKVLGILDDLLKQIDEDPYIQKPLDDLEKVRYAEQVRKEDESLQGTLNKFLRAALERNRQKFSKFDTFDDALDAAEQILERQEGGQRKLFYTSDGAEQYVTFAEQAERLARLLFENQ